MFLFYPHSWKIIAWDEQFLVEFLSLRPLKILLSHGFHGCCEDVSLIELLFLFLSSCICNLLSVLEAVQCGHTVPGCTFLFTLQRSINPLESGKWGLFYSLSLTATLPHIISFSCMEPWWGSVCSGAKGRLRPILCFSMLSPVTSSRMSSSSLIFYTTVSNLLPNLFTELTTSFILFYFSILFSYLPPQFWSSVVHLFSIPSLISSSIWIKFPPTRPMLNHVFVLGFLVLHEGTWLLAGTHVSWASHGEFPGQTSFSLLFFYLLFFSCSSRSSRGSRFSLWVCGSVGGPVLCGVSVWSPRLWACLPGRSLSLPGLQVTRTHWPQWALFLLLPFFVASTAGLWRYCKDVQVLCTGQGPFNRSSRDLSSWKMSLFHPPLSLHFSPPHTSFLYIFGVVPLLWKLMIN